jgi:hypothetical protein
LSDTVPGSEHDFDERRGMHSFIVRVWLEMSEAETDHEIWRGHIIHLPDYKRYYFSDLDQIAMFIAAQLKGQQGVPSDSS